jgi:hypothetical protein
LEEQENHETPVSLPVSQMKFEKGTPEYKSEFLLLQATFLVKRLILKKKINTYTKILYAALLVYMLSTTSRYVKHTTYEVLSFMYSECHPNIQTHCTFKNSEPEEEKHIFLKLNQRNDFSPLRYNSKASLFF